MAIPTLINGGKYSDARGNIAFVNDFKFSDVKRFYIIEHNDTLIVRAWQGHKKEKKYFYVLKGSFTIKLLKPDNWDNPSDKILPDIYTLNDTDSKILSVPEGYINGFKALEANSILIVFSNMEKEESENDLIRFPLDYWGF